MRSRTLLVVCAAGIAAAVAGGAGIDGAHAQGKPAEAAASAGCEPGFERRTYPHGSQHNFRCRTRVIDCPSVPGHRVEVVPEPSFETARGVQFGYQCRYTRDTGER